MLLVIALGGTLVLKNTVAQAFSIPSESMTPQLLVGDRVAVSRLAYELHDPRRGDIIVFREPGAKPEDQPWLQGALDDILQTVGLRQPHETELIKRVVGLPGERIEARGGDVYIDGRRLVEPYLPKRVITDDFGPRRVPPDHVFVLGDNRGNSADSRVIGPVPEENIIGRAVARVWPPQRIAFL